MNEDDSLPNASAAPNMLAFWGKTYAGQDLPRSKPVVHHLFDAAAVAYELLEFRPAFLARLSHLLGVPLQVARNSAHCWPGCMTLAVLGTLPGQGPRSMASHRARPDG